MVKLFTGVILSIVSLIILNYVIKETRVYQWIVSILGGIISLITIGTLPIAIISLIRKNSMMGFGIIGIITIFSKSKIVGILRDSFFKAVVYVLGIWMLEKYFGDIASGLSHLSVILVSFGPVFIMILGLIIILKSARIC